MDKPMELEKEIKQKQFRSEYHKLVVNLMYTQSWLASAQAKLFKEFDLTSAQYNVLRILRGQHPKPATVNLIIERMIDKMSNASRIVDKLVAKELVQRCVCPHDRRAVDVLITQEGLELLRKIDDRAPEMEGWLHVTPEEAAQLNYLLDKMRG